MVICFRFFIYESKKGNALLMQIAPQPYPFIDGSIDSVHKRVHDGYSFYYHDLILLPSGSSQDYIITTPNTDLWSHFGLEIEYCDYSGITQLFEGTDRNGTTLQTAFNRNRNSTNLPTLTVHKGQTGGTTDGTRIYWKLIGAGKISGGTTGTAEERILKQNTKYLLRLINSGNSNNNVAVVLRWYEHRFQ